jgi:hypothetical protein
MDKSNMTELEQSFPDMIARKDYSGTLAAVVSAIPKSLEVLMKYCLPDTYGAIGQGWISRAMPSSYA